MADVKLSAEQAHAIARLYENESLTDNLTDPDARAVLEWAQEQIAANADGALVQAAVRAANNSGEQGVQALLAQARTFLTLGLSARGGNAAPAPLATFDEPPETGSSRQDMRLTPPQESGPLSADSQAASLGASAQVGESAAPEAAAAGAVAPRAAAPETSAKKILSKSRRKKKSKS